MLYEAIIGLEIHIQIKTKSKMFCACKNAEADSPNTHICPICTGQPGTLPAVNAEAITKGLSMALALHCSINQQTKFDRKHYFYPDLPKGYQISQFDLPLGKNGYLEVKEEEVLNRKIGIERLHLEEDSAKNTHQAAATLVDFNRAGVPLMEIVTKPELRTPQEAKLFLQELQKLARYLNISDADMEKGQLRCDVNISLRPAGDIALYPKTEIKNINSFKSVERALEYEIKRQEKLWEAHTAPEKLETRGWNDATGETVLQRVKEEAADYRYFPEPDLPPLSISDAELELVRARIPEMPEVRKQRFREEYELSVYDATVLTTDPRVANYFEDTISELRGWLNSLDSTEGSDEDIWLKNRKKVGRLVCSWLTNEVFKLLNTTGQSFKDLKITPENLAEFLTLIYQNKVNSSAAQVILKAMFERGADPGQVMQEEKLEQVHDADALGKYCEEVIKANPKIVNDYKAGNARVLMFLVGQVMKLSKGQANPQMVTDLLREKLKT